MHLQYTPSLRSCSLGLRVRSPKPLSMFVYRSGCVGATNHYPPVLDPHGLIFLTDLFFRALTEF